MVMNTRLLRALGSTLALGVVLVTSTRCELLVDLDRSAVDGGEPDGCAICAEPPDGGEDGGDASGDAAVHEGGSTDADAGAGPSDGGGEAAVDAGAGG
jgi:hypothetical protein